MFFFGISPCASSCGGCHVAKQCVCVAMWSCGVSVEHTHPQTRSPTTWQNNNNNKHAQHGHRETHTHTRHITHLYQILAHVPINSASELRHHGIRLQCSNKESGSHFCPLHRAQIDGPVSPPTNTHKGPHFVRSRCSDAFSNHVSTALLSSTRGWPISIC